VFVYVQGFLVKLRERLILYYCVKVKISLINLLVRMVEDRCVIVCVCNLCVCVCVIYVCVRACVCTRVCHKS